MTKNIEEYTTLDIMNYCDLETRYFGENDGEIIVDEKHAREVLVYNPGLFKLNYDNNNKQEAEEKAKEIMVVLENTLNKWFLVKHTETKIIMDIADEGYILLVMYELEPKRIIDIKE
jgi:hypothetical protein